MKYLSALVLASGLVFGLASAAQAAPQAEEFYADNEPVTAERGTTGHPYHRCHASASGTGDHACGTLTGGPSGGLF